MCAVSRAHSVTHACQCCRRPASTAAAAIYQVFCGLRRPDRLGDPGSPRRVWLPAVHPRRASDRSRSLRPQVGQTRPCSAIGPAGIVQATTSVPLAPHTPGFVYFGRPPQHNYSLQRAYCNATQPITTPWAKPNQASSKHHRLLVPSNPHGLGDPGSPEPWRLLGAS